jgi:hypothetical protein
MADIQTLINAIPDAQDGNVITSDYHNTIKTALAAIAGQLGAGTSGQSNAVTLVPNFLPAPGNPWNVNIGVATDAAGSNGWMPVYLPDGAAIQQMVAIGAKTATATQGVVSLLIQPLADTTTTTLILIDLSPAGNPFHLTGFPSVPGAGPNGLRDLQTVKNSVNKYLIRAQTFSNVPATVTINTLRVVFTMP